MGCVDRKEPTRRRRRRRKEKRYEREVGKKHKARDRNKGESVSVCHA